MTPVVSVTPVRVATFNLLHGRTVTDGAINPDRLAAAATELDADVIGLQEVDHGQPRSGRADQTTVVADALGARWHRFVPALEGTPGERWTATHHEDGATVTGPAYGVGLVSRYPMHSFQVRRFPPAPLAMPLMVPGSPGLSRVDDEPRVAVAAVVETDAGPVSVVCTHLSFVPGWNVRQLRALVRWAARTMPAPRLLVGDLNLPGSVVRAVTQWPSLGRLPTYPSWRPRVQLDHVLVDRRAGVVVDAVAALRLPVSDHRGLVVDLHLSAGG